MKPRLVVYGDINVDLLATVDQLPETGQDMTVNDLFVGHGGSAANCAVIAASLGMPAAFYGAVGNDAWAEPLVSEMAGFGIDTRGVRSVPGKTGTTVSIITDSGERTFLSYRGANALDLREFLPKNVFQELDCLHLSGYSFQDRGSSDTALFLMEQAVESRAIVSLNASYQFARHWDTFPRTLFQGLDILIANQDEARWLSGNQDHEKSAGTIQALGPKIVVITLGKEGCVALDKKGTPHHIPSYPVGRVVDTTGAGDAFCAGFLTGYLLGLDVVQAAKLANATAVTIIGQIGGRNHPPAMKEITSILVENGEGDLADRINQQMRTAGL